jgi:hypothetical protein
VGEEKWYDPLGEVYDCVWYASDDADGFCGQFASVQNPNFGRTANEACCVCGGGVAYTVTTTVTGSTTTECFDWQPSLQEVWYDGKGNTCEYYVRELLVRSTCSESENFGMMADQACCVCGGGVGKTNTRTSSSRTSSTTLSSTISSATFTQTAVPIGSTVSSVEETEASSLSFAVILALIAVGLLVAWIAGLSFLKFGCGYRLGTPKTHPPAKGHGPSRSPRRVPRARGRGQDIVFDRDRPEV